MKKFTRIGACLVASIVLIAAVLCVGCSSDMYSEEKHMQRIRERAEKRFLGGRQRIYRIGSISDL